MAGTTRLELATSGVTEEITRFSDHLFFLYLFEIAYLCFARCVVLCNPVHWISKKKDTQRDTRTSKTALHSPIPSLPSFPKLSPKLFIELPISILCIQKNKIRILIEWRHSEKRGNHHWRFGVYSRRDKNQAWLRALLHCRSLFCQYHYHRQRRRWKDWNLLSQLWVLIMSEQAQLKHSNTYAG